MLADRVKETSTTTGTGSFTLAGAVSGFQSFSAGIGNNKCFYVIDGGSEWEVGIGTISGGTTLARDTVLSSSNSNSAVNFSAGTKYVFCSPPTSFLEPTINVASDGATVTFDLSKSPVQQVTLGGNRTLALSNVRVGQRFILRIVQDSSPPRSVTWFSTIKWPNNTAPTLTNGSGKVDVFGFICTSSGNYDGFIIGQNL